MKEDVVPRIPLFKASDSYTPESDELKGTQHTTTSKPEQSYSPPASPPPTLMQDSKTDKHHPIVSVVKDSDTVVVTRCRSHSAATTRKEVEAETQKSKPKEKQRRKSWTERVSHKIEKWWMNVVKKKPAPVAPPPVVMEKPSTTTSEHSSKKCNTRHRACTMCYHTENPDNVRLLNRVRSRRKLWNFYLQHNPAKVKDIDKILDGFEGREDELFRMLEEKYGYEVKDPDNPIVVAEVPTKAQKILDDPSDRRSRGGRTLPNSKGTGSRQRTLSLPPAPLAYEEKKEKVQEAVSGVMCPEGHVMKYVNGIPTYYGMFIQQRLRQLAVQIQSRLDEEGSANALHSIRNQTTNFSQMGSSTVSVVEQTMLTTSYRFPVHWVCDICDTKIPHDTKDVLHCSQCHYDICPPCSLLIRYEK
eukprot:PhF_6_TR30459/c0_g1_i2/m.44744